MKTLPIAGPCSCKPGIGRDNCPQCEGTGKRIDWAQFHLEKRLRESKRETQEQTQARDGMNWLA